MWCRYLINNFALFSVQQHLNGYIIIVSTHEIDVHFAIGALRCTHTSHEFILDTALEADAVRGYVMLTTLAVNNNLTIIKLFHLHSVDLCNYTACFLSPPHKIQSVLFISILIYNRESRLSLFVRVFCQRQRVIFPFWVFKII